jgi:hypothetical protein
MENWLKGKHYRLKMKNYRNWMRYSNQVNKKK